MANIDDLLQEFPESSRNALRAGWSALPNQRQEELLSLIPALPSTPGKVQKLFELSNQQLQMTFGQKHDVAIVGPANVGKSTLFNQLIAAKTDRAEVSPVPGTTRATQEAPAGPFAVVDTPGADAVGEVGQRERAMALDAAREADFLVIMFDAVQGVKQTEQQLFLELRALYRPFIVVLNKIDLVKGAETAVVAQVAANLGLAAAEVIPISAEKKRNLDQVVLAIVKAEPRLIAALGQGLPAYRAQLAWQVIFGAATSAGLVALTPLPFVDFIPLLAIQTSMILGIGRIYNYHLSLGRVRELIGVFGLGFLGRTLFYELIKIGGPPAWVVSSVVAAGTTVTMGYAAMLWFGRGERISRETTRELQRNLTRNLLTALRNPRQWRLSREGFTRNIQEAAGETLGNQEQPEVLRIEEEDLGPAG